MSEKGMVEITDNYPLIPYIVILKVKVIPYIWKLNYYMRK